MRRTTALKQFLFAHRLGLSPAISSQFILEVCTADENCKKKH